jgi:hypothetical protein
MPMPFFWGRRAWKTFSQRKVIVEPVFSGLRRQQGLDRFRRRGLQGVTREFALHVMAYNLSRAVALRRARFFWLYVAVFVFRESVNVISAACRHFFICAFNRSLAQDRCARKKRFATPSEGRGFAHNSRIKETA